MDIEGAEYEVVPHMASMQAWSVMDELLVEWHGRGELGGGSLEEMQLCWARAQAAKNKLISEGVQMPV
ncbi:hypothetical protein BGZ83_008065, partial [Gryganskiella cystojenkinii]